MRKTKRLLSALLTAALLMVCLVPAAAAEGPYDEKTVYEKLIALKESYPEGMRWTNYDGYMITQYDAERHLTTNYYGFGCVAFAYILSDAAFAGLPLRQYSSSEYSYEQLRVGDILRINNDTHSVVILEKYDDHLILAEGNYNSSIHWGRSLSKSALLSSWTDVTTRYPEETAETPPEPAPTEESTLFSDVADPGAYYYGPVYWAVEQGITNGTSESTFSPELLCTRAQILTFLWRACGEIRLEGDLEPFTDVKESDYYYDAARWAWLIGLVEGGELSGETPCTRAETVGYFWTLCGQPEAEGVAFRDVEPDSETAAAVAWAVAAGVTTGTSETTFSPEQTCTRGQIVTFLWRLLAA